MSECHQNPLEIMLQQEPGVLEHKILARMSALHEQEWVVYGVLAEGCSLDDVRARVTGNAGCAGLPDCRWVEVLFLPQTADGELDGEALAQLPVPDDFLMESWRETLNAQAAIADVAVVARQAGEALGYLHLSDVLPPSSLIQNPVEPAVPAVRNTLLKDNAGRVPAFLEGKPLAFPPDMPAALPAFLRKAAAKAQGENIVYIDADGGEHRQSYATLLAKAESILAGLRRAGLRPGDKVIVQLQHNEAILPAFWGCLLGGFIPLIMTPPPSDREANNDLDRLAYVYRHLQGPFILVDAARRESLGDLSTACGIALEHILFADELRACAPDSRHHDGRPDDTAFLTLTSGSTGAPKCIELSHHSLIARALGANQANGHRADDVILNWLPFDHIGSISDWHVRCVILGCRLVYAPKEHVLGYPLNWLALIHRYRVTHGWAPNFAYGLILDALENQQGHDDWDLSCVKALLSAGEAVSPAIVAAFLAGLAGFGFSSHAIRPAFGMAEMGSGVTYFQAGAEHPLRFHTLDRASLDVGKGVIAVAASHPNAVNLTSLGPPIPGVALRIVDAHGQLLPMNTVGHFQVKGAAVSSGYYADPEATAQAFLDDGWFDTGDLGFLADGELVISGRAKEVIIINGANFANAEIEAVAEHVPGVAVSFTAACAVRMPGSAAEELAIFFCLAEAGGNTLTAVLPALRETLLKTLGLMPAYLIPLEREDVPKTAIGKIQRKQLARRLESGELDAVLKQVDIVLRNNRTLPGWFYQRAWQRKNAVPALAAPPTGLHVIIADNHGLADSLQTQLEALGNTCLRLPAVTAPALEKFTAPGLPLAHVWHLAGYAPHAGDIGDAAALEAAQEQGVYSLLALAQALAACAAVSGEDSARIPLFVAASHAQAVTANELIAYEKAPVVALLKSLAAELPWLDCRHIDLPAAGAAENTACLLAEAACRDPERETAWRDGSRYVSRLRKTALQPPGAALPLVAGGLYLITGGLGGMGVEIANFLLQDYNAKLLLIGQTALPGANDTVTDVKTAARLEAWRQLQGAGRALRYAAVDVCDPAALEQAVQQAESHWQTPLSGVFHLAGVAHERMAREESRAGLSAVMRPKLAGALAIRHVLASRPDAIAVYSSSAAGFFGGAGIGAYAAANAFLDAFASQQNRQGQRSYSLGWSMWDEVGMSRGSKAHVVLEAKGYCLISPQEGIRSLLAALAQDRPNLLIGLDGGKPHVRRRRADVAANAGQLAAFYTASAETPGALPDTLQVRDRFGTPSPCSLTRVAAIPRAADGAVDGDELSRLLAQRDGRAAQRYLAPGSALEIQITAIWQDVLKKTKIGMLDNFFNLGGASLQAVQCVARINQALGLELPPGVLFGHPTVRELSAHAARQVQGDSASPIPRLARDAPPEASFSQLRLRILDELGAGEAYNIPVALRLQGEFDLAAFRQALDNVVQRHEVLRTHFPSGATRPLLQAAATATVTVVDLSAPTPAAREAALLDHAREDALRPFNLDEDVLLRATLLRLADKHCMLLLNLHHIAGDGWSLRVLARELRDGYAAFQAGQAAELPELPIQYADFAAWQRQTLQGERLKNLLGYWKQQLAGAPSQLQLPVDFPYPSMESYRGGQHPVHIPAALANTLRQLGAQAGATLYMTLLAAFNVLLYRYGGQDDLVIGSPIACRTRPELEPLLGFFANTLALRARVDGQAGFNTLLAQVSETAQAAYNHQDVPFEKLVDELQLPRTLTYNPLVQVLFALQDVAADEFSFAGMDCRPLELPGERALFDLELQLWETPAGLDGFFRYKRALFRENSIARMAGNLEVLLHGIAAAPDAALNALPLLTQAEQRQLQAWNATAADYPKEQTLASLFEAQAAKTPDAIAVVFEEQQLSYIQLNAQANRLARHLRALGVKPDTPVAIGMDRSLDLVISLLAILKAGGAYVPLDLTYPPERLAFMMEDTKAPVLLTHSSLIPQLPACKAQLVCLDKCWNEIDGENTENLHCDTASDNLAYIIYTSGSTGVPKGVEICHYNIARLLLNNTYARFDNKQTFLLSAPIAFDASTFELWGALLHGARCVIYPERIPTLEGLEDIIRQQKISILWLTASLFNLIIDEKPGMLATVAQILTGGEALSPNHIQRALKQLPNSRLINGYGPTESTTFACCYAIPKTIAHQEHSIPIGYPIANTQLYILDKHLQPVPIGVAGELHIGGDGLGRGYLNRPELTAEKFIKNPFSDNPKARLYKTGDLTRYLPDGAIDFLGRMDHQVKVRGFRIELGEIESILGQHPQLREIAVGVYESMPGNKRLVAYLVAHDGSAPTPAELRDFLKPKLPEFMVPSAFVFLDAFPLTPNGKLDRKALPEPDTIKGAAAFEAPRGEVEQQLAAIWEAVLGVGQVGRGDNFFELGGHSLLATQVIVRLRQAFKLDMALRHLFVHKTLPDLAAYVDSLLRAQALLVSSEEDREDDEMGVL
jgi:amino acid adenylation domain-containing protein